MRRQPRTRGALDKVARCDVLGSATRARSRELRHDESAQARLVLLRCCGQILDCLLHVMADRPLESFAIASLQQVQNILVFLHQGIRSRVGNLQVENAHSRFGCQRVVSPD